MKHRKNWFKARRPAKEKARIAWDSYRATVTQKLHPDLDLSDLQAYFSTREYNDMSVEGFKQATSQEGPHTYQDVVESLHV